jgi:hypothetical protein
MATSLFFSRGGDASAGVVKPVDSSTSLPNPDNLRDLFSCK